MKVNFLNETRKRFLIALINLIIITICVIITKVFEIETTNVKIIGSYASVFIIAAVLFKFPYRFYLMAMCYDILATAFGSVLNFYKSIDIYDRIIHYLSGILLAEAGIILVTYLFKKRDITPDKLVMLIFAFLFSAACAGFWEIYEFTADQLFGVAMQGDNLNTMGDIVAGVLGAVTYLFIALIRYKKSNL